MALCYPKEAFNSPNFEVVQFVSELRQTVPLDTLRNDLNRHFQSLKTELLELINRDYNDFVSLSANLVGVDRVIAGLKEPLGRLRGEVSGVKDAVGEAMTAMEVKLAERRELADQKSQLQLFINIHEAIQRTEERLRSEEWDPSAASSADSSRSDSEDAELPRPPIDSESGLWGVGGPQVTGDLATSRMVERVASEFNRLSFFVNRANHLPFASTISTKVLLIQRSIRERLESCFQRGVERQDSAVLGHCLRAYSSLDSTSSAESLVRNVIVVPFLQRAVRKDGERSPDALAKIFEDILLFVQDKMDVLLELTYGPGAIRGIHFIANSVWVEVEEIVSTTIPGIYNAGVPDAFLKNYTISMNLIERMESLCRSADAVVQFRQHPSYTKFIKRWPLRVYSQLRFNEISTKLDSVLSRNVQLLPVPAEHPEQAYRLDAPAAVEEAIMRCWSPDVFIPALAHGFLRLSLQSLSRYRTWLVSGLQYFTALQKSAASAAELPRAGWAILAPEQSMLPYRDTQLLLSRVQYLIPRSVSGSEEEAELIQAAVRESVESLESVLPSLSKVVTTAVVTKCVDNLQAIRSITAMYRMTNKPPPTKHLLYVPNILQPLAIFVTEATQHVQQETVAAWISDVISLTTDRYAEMASELLATVRKMEVSLKKLQPKKTSVPSSTSALTDTDKICRQLYLDAEEFGRQLQRFDIDHSTFPSFSRLWEAVSPVSAS